MKRPNTDTTRDINKYMLQDGVPLFLSVRFNQIFFISQTLYTKQVMFHCIIYLGHFLFKHFVEKPKKKSPFACENIFFKKTCEKQVSLSMLHLSA